MNKHGRAENRTDRMAVLNSILAAWERQPEQRLGQLIYNAMSCGRIRGANVGDAELGYALFYVEDKELAEVAERFTRAG